MLTHWNRLPSLRRISRFVLVLSVGYERNGESPETESPQKQRITRNRVVWATRITKIWTLFKSILPYLALSLGCLFRYLILSDSFCYQIMYFVSYSFTTASYYIMRTAYRCSVIVRLRAIPPFAAAAATGQVGWYKTGVF